MLKQKFLSVLLILSMLLSALTLVSVSAEDAAPAATPATTVVATVDGTDITLADLTEQLKTSAFANQTIVLKQDVVLGEWTSAPNFNGTLDGAGYKISGLTAPLFAKVNGATVKNLTIEGSLALENPANAGLLASEATATVTVENCTTNGSITVTTTVATNLGGFFGKAANVVFTNCTNNCVLNLSKDGSTATDKTIQAGGFAGLVNGDITALGCTNNGSMLIKTSATCLIGGFVGMQTGNGTNKRISFEKCVNYGEVNAPIGTGGCKAGGIASVLNQWNNTYIFKNCINYGDITSVSISGGIFSDSRGGTTLDHCFNFGKITATSSASNVNAVAGGIAGQVHLSNAANVPTLPVVRECVNYGVIDTSKNTTNNTTFAGGIMGMSTINFGAFENNVSVGAITSGRYASGLIGKLGVLDNNKLVNSTLKNCVVLATVTGKVNEAAGIVAHNQFGGNLTVDACYFTEQSGAVAVANKQVASATYTCLGYEDNSKTLDENSRKTKEDLIALLAVRHMAVQSTKVSDGTFNVRFIAGLDSLAYSKAGFELIRVEAGGIPSSTVDKSTNTVYTSLTGYDENGTEKVYSATGDFQSNYLAAVTVNHIPADRTVTFLVRPYLLSEDGEVRTFGTACTVTYANGVLVTE